MNTSGFKRLGNVHRWLEPNRSALLFAVAILIVAALACWARLNYAVSPPWREGAYHACALYQERGELFFEEDTFHRITRLFLDPAAPWSSRDVILDYGFLGLFSRICG